MRLKEIPPEVYAREVLPLTFPLWAGSRSFDEYVTHTIEIARGAYGRRHYRSLGLYDGRRLVASFKRYERELHDGDFKVKAVGFGAVFTSQEFRGRGYASVMMASELDRSRREGFGLAYLFSDIRPEFYTTFGFRALPSRTLTVRADALPARRVHPMQLQQGDWVGLRRCFDACESGRAAGFLRNASVWGWIQMRMRQGSERAAGRDFNFVVRRNRGVRAYVLGTRIPERDTYWLEEFGFADEGSAELVPALVRAAAGDLRRIKCWVPPDAFRPLLPKGTALKRNRSILMFAPLRREGQLLLDSIDEKGDFCWATDHI